MAQEQLEFLGNVDRPSDLDPTPGFARSGQRSVQESYRDAFLYTAEFVQMIMEGRKPMRYLAHALNGNLPTRQLQEAMTPNDFTYIFGDVIDRVVLGGYRAAPSDWRQFLKVGTVRDFRNANRFGIDGGESRLDAVPMGGTYPEDTVSDSRYQIAVGKYGRTFKLFWETFINDDLDALRNFPARLTRAARRTEDYVASSSYVANTTLYETTHVVAGSNYSNKGTAALTIAALEAAWKVMMAYPDEDGEWIDNAPVYLVTGRSLAIEAQKILGTTLFAVSGGDSQTGIAPTRVVPDNVFRGKLTPLVDPMIETIDTTNGATSWYLFTNPAVMHAAEVAFLAGYEEPQLFQRTSRATRLGGSENVPASFEDDELAFKVRHVVGSQHANAIGYWRGTYWSDGTA